MGNLYFNRKCTGAMVGAHPFGGFNMSGTDSKAGGPDYLFLFTQAKSVAEKLQLRRQSRRSGLHRSGCLHLLLEFAAHFGGSLRQHAVVDGEQRQLQTVADAGLVVNRAQIVLDHLLGRLEAQRDLAILAALDDERHDPHFLGRKPVADARAHHILFR